MRIKYYYVNLKTMVLFGIALLAISFIPSVILVTSKITSGMKVIIALVWIFLMCSYFYFSILNKKIIFDEEGVQLKSFRRRKLIKWNEMKEIGIVNYSPFPLATSALFLCFSTEIGQTGKSIVRFSDKCIYMRYRKSVLEILPQFWSQKIDEF